MPNRSEQRNQFKRRTDWVVRIPLFFACIATATLALLDSVGVRGGRRRGRTGWCWRCCCGWWGGIANTASCCTFAVRRFNADLSAWLRQKLARGGLEGPSVALGVIPPLCATLGPVLVGPEGCSRGRWRSGPSKWRHTAAPEGRVREHHAPVGALRRWRSRSRTRPRGCQGAPRTCRCIETSDRGHRTPPRR